MIEDTAKKGPEAGAELPTSAEPPTAKATGEAPASSRDSSRVRERILTEARTLFARFGYRKTSMEDIARAVSMGKASLYYYFKGKEALFGAVVQREAALLTDQIRAAVERASDPESKVRAFLITRMTELRNVTNLHKVTGETYRELLPFIEEAGRSYLDDEVTLLGSILEDGRRQGAFQVEDSKLVALSLLAASKGIEETFWLMGRRDDQERALELLLQVFLRGLRPAHGPR